MGILVLTFVPVLCVVVDLGPAFRRLHFFLASNNAVHFLG